MNEAAMALPYIWKALYGLLSAVMGLLFWNFKGLRSDLDDINEKHHKHEIDSAEKFGAVTASIRGIHESNGEIKNDIRGLREDVKELIKKK